MSKKISMYTFIILIFIVPIASFIDKDSEKSELLNSSLQMWPSVKEDKSVNELIAEFQQYFEDQIIGHETIFKIKDKWEYLLHIKSSAIYYDIPKLNISYQYDKQVITEPAYIKDFDETCSNYQDTNFLYYVVPDRRVSIPDEYVKYDYNQYSNEYRQEMIRKDLDLYKCINTSYNPDMLKLTDYYNYDHHYNSKGVYLVYSDLINTYNKLFNTNLKILQKEELKTVEVSSQLYLNDKLNDIIPNFTTETLPKNAKVGKGTPYKVIGYKREGLYENPSADAGKILFITDSYGQAMLPYITEDFASIESVNFYDYASDPSLLDEKLKANKYDTVIIYTYDYNVYQNQEYKISN